MVGVVALGFRKKLSNSSNLFIHVNGERDAEMVVRKDEMG